MKLEVGELETADYDIWENIKTALYRLWSMKAVVFFCTLIGFCASLVFLGIVGVRTNYYTSASIYSVVYGSYSESNSGVVVMNTYSGLLGTTKVCDRAADKLVEKGITSAQLHAMVKNGDIILSGASSDSKKYGFSLKMVVTSASPENVVDIANAMAVAYTDEINDLLGNSALQVLDEAIDYRTAKSLNVKLYMLLFTAVGFVLSAGIIFVKEFFSGKVYSVAQCEADKDYILGLLPYYEKTR